MFGLLGLFVVDCLLLAVLVVFIDVEVLGLELLDGLHGARHEEDRLRRNDKNTNNNNNNNNNNNKNDNHINNNTK